MIWSKLEKVLLHQLSEVFLHHRSGNFESDFEHSDEQLAAMCSQHYDYCLIELETTLTISSSVQAIGIEEFGPSLPLEQIETVSPDTTTVTGSTIETTEHVYPANPNLDRCWIAAWSDDILRTSFADLNNLYNDIGSGSKIPPYYIWVFTRHLQDSPL